MEGNSCKHSPLQFPDAEFEFAAEPLGACSVVGDGSDHEHLSLEDHDLNELVANDVFSTGNRRVRNDHCHHNSAQYKNIRSSIIKYIGATRRCDALMR